MADAPTPTQPARKRGLGCVGWGLIVLAILAVPVVIILVLGGLGYAKYGWIQAISSDTGDYMTMPAENWEQDRELAIVSISGFQGNLQNHQPTQLQLNAPGINALVMTELNAAQMNQFNVQFTFNGDEGEAKLTIPSDWVFNGTVKGRYFNADITFKPSFDATNKRIVITADSIKMSVPNPQRGAAGALNDILVPLDPSHYADVAATINNSINSTLQGDPIGKEILDQAASVNIINGYLIIVTH